MIRSTETKAAITVSQMARMVGLSRSRFYQLQGTAFPQPVYDCQTRRPYYTTEQQQVCLEVRRRNCGIDGQPILFYAASRPTEAVRTQRTRKPKKNTSRRPSGRLRTILDGVQALGLSSVTESQIEKTVVELFPEGTSNVEQGEVIRAVFVTLMRQNSGGSVGR